MLYVASFRSERKVAYGYSYMLACADVRSFFTLCVALVCQLFYPGGSRLDLAAKLTAVLRSQFFYFL